MAGRGRREIGSLQAYMAKTELREGNAASGVRLYADSRSLVNQENIIVLKDHGKGIHLGNLGIVDDQLLTGADPDIL